MLTLKNNLSARDGRIFAFQWAEATFPMGGSNLSNGRKQKFRQSEENQATVAADRQPKNTCKFRKIFVILRWI